MGKWWFNDASWWFHGILWDVPSGKRLHYYGLNHQFEVGKLMKTHYRLPFSIAVLYYRRVDPPEVKSGSCVEYSHLSRVS